MADALLPSATFASAVISSTTIDNLLDALLTKFSHQITEFGMTIQQEMTAFKLEQGRVAASVDTIQTCILQQQGRAVQPPPQADPPPPHTNSALVGALSHLHRTDQPAASPASASTAAPRATTPSSTPTTPIPAPSSSSQSRAAPSTPRVEPAVGCMPPPAPLLVKQMATPSSMSTATVTAPPSTTEASLYLPNAVHDDKVPQSSQQELARTSGAQITAPLMTSLSATEPPWLASLHSTGSFQFDAIQLQSLLLGHFYRATSPSTMSFVPLLNESYGASGAQFNESVPHLRPFKVPQPYGDHQQLPVIGSGTTSLRHPAPGTLASPLTDLVVTSIAPSSVDQSMASVSNPHPALLAPLLLPGLPPELMGIRSTGAQIGVANLVQEDAAVAVHERAIVYLTLPSGGGNNLTSMQEAASVADPACMQMHDKEDEMVKSGYDDKLEVSLCATTGVKSSATLQLASPVQDQTLNGLVTSASPHSVIYVHGLGGYKWTGQLLKGITATDLIMLRKQDAASNCVEFYGESMGQLFVADRATSANMSPEYGYGITMGFFSTDHMTLHSPLLDNLKDDCTSAEGILLKEKEIEEGPMSSDGTLAAGLVLTTGFLEDLINECATANVTLNKTTCQKHKTAHNHSADLLLPLDSPSTVWSGQPLIVLCVAPLEGFELSWRCDWLSFMWDDEHLSMTPWHAKHSIKWHGGGHRIITHQIYCSWSSAHNQLGIQITYRWNWNHSCPQDCWDCCRCWFLSCSRSTSCIWAYGTWPWNSWRTSATLYQAVPIHSSQPSIHLMTTEEA